MVARGVAAAMKDAQIADPADIHFVQIKCPLLTAQKVPDAATRGHKTATQDTLKSMGLSRAASALGVAVALGEIARMTIQMTISGRNGRSGRAAPAAPPGSSSWARNRGARHVETMVGRLAIDHAVMADSIDVEPVRAALTRLGLGSPGQMRDNSRMVAMLAKAEAEPRRAVRGKRHTMLDDSDISSTRHARAFVSGALAGLVGHAEIYVSGGAEHQGPDGGGPVAIIAERR